MGNSHPPVLVRGSHVFASWCTCFTPHSHSPSLHILVCCTLTLTITRNAWIFHGVGVFLLGIQQESSTQVRGRSCHGLQNSSDSGRSGNPITEWCGRKTEVCSQHSSPTCLPLDFLFQKYHNYVSALLFWIFCSMWSFSPVADTVILEGEKILKILSRTSKESRKQFWDSFWDLMSCYLKS